MQINLEKIKKDAQEEQAEKIAKEQATRERQAEGLPKRIEIPAFRKKHTELLVFLRTAEKRRKEEIPELNASTRLTNEQKDLLMSIDDAKKKLRQARAFGGLQNISTEDLAMEKIEGQPEPKQSEEGELQPLVRVNTQTKNQEQQPDQKYSRAA